MIFKCSVLSLICIAIALLMASTMLLTQNTYSYDNTIKNKYGRVIGYVKGDEITDKYGRTEYYIDEEKVKITGDDAQFLIELIECDMDCDK